MNKLSILIASLYNRETYLERLLSILKPQLREGVEVLMNTDNGESSIGKKRNELLDQATGDYIVFVDDDDIIEPYYVAEILQALENSPDVVGIHLLHFEDGTHTGLTYHSIKYTSWWDEPNRLDSRLTNYYRNPNHLNPVKREYATAVRFPEINHGEDKAYSMNILKYLKIESYIDKPIYTYLYRSKK